MADQDRGDQLPAIACSLASGSDRCHWVCERVDERADDVVLLEDVDLDEQRRIMEGIQRGVHARPSENGRVTKRSKMSSRDKGLVEGQRSILDMFGRKS